MTLTTIQFTGNAPHVGSTLAAGSDLIITDTVTIRPGRTERVSTGTYLALPPGHYGHLTTRSSIAKHGISLAQGTGIIDADYRGEIIAYLVNHGIRPHTLHAGERVLQIVIQQHTTPQWVETDHLDTTDRGDGGFGSTGK